MAGADTETAGDGGPDPMEDADAWQNLSRGEQSELLDEGVADLKGEGGDGAWRHLSETEQEQTISAIEDGGERAPADQLSETERAMQAALSETWTAEVFADLEDVPTVPFECRELSAKEQEILQEAGRAVMQIEEEVEDLDDASEADVEGLSLDLDHFDSAEDLNEWIPAFLADVTVDDAFDTERFETGERLRPNTRRLLFLEVFLRYHEESERAMKFRSER